jgi:hypothetical protein
MNRNQTSLTAAAILAALAGCGSDLITPTGGVSNAFVSRVAIACGSLSVGTRAIDDLLDLRSDDIIFLDETAKLGTGEVDADTYRDTINRLYPTGNNRPAIDCVIEQLD